jgi:hypothetical protein
MSNNPLTRNGFDAIAYNAVGRASEVNNYEVYKFYWNVIRTGLPKPRSSPLMN